MIERHHLIMVKAIDEHGTVTKAANKLCLTQSALSHSMKKLDGIVGTSIWEKSGRRLMLTQEGRKLLSAAGKILSQFEKVENDMLALMHGQAGNIKIGIECFPCFQWLLKVVAPFLKSYPNIDVDVKNEFKFGGLGALINFEIDLLVTPDPLYQKKLTYIPIFNYQQVLVVHKNDPLAAKKVITPQDLADKTLFTYPVERERLDIFTHFLSPNGGSVKQHKTLENTEMILQMVKHGRGVAALPDWLVDIQQEEDVVTLKIGEQGLHKCTYIAIRSNDADNAIINNFIEQSKTISL